jgi:twinkle protein
MRYQSSNTKQLFDISFESGIKKRYTCPECSVIRKKAKQKDLEYYPETNRAYCWHCNTTFFEYKPYDKKQYVVPEWKNKTNLTDKAVKWFEGRTISQKSLNKMKVYSDNEYMPQFSKETEVVCFPYFRDNELVNIKYRGANKSFKLHSGSELIFWNIDCLKEFKEVIIVEGEMDALTYVEAGFNNVMSVPNGAGNNLEYLNIDDFKGIEKIYISVDNDSKGIELRDELIRRLGVERCFTVDLKEQKDANDFVFHYSYLQLQDAVKESKQPPIKGIVNIEHIYNDLVDMFESGIKPGLKIGNDEIDQYCTWETGKLVVVTGEPNSGKSEFIDYIVSSLNYKYGWKAAYFTPENYPLKYHYSKIYEKFIGSPFKKGNNEIEFDMAFNRIKDNFFYILNEDDLTPEGVLKSAKYLVSKEGIKILVIDPYNKLDHQRKQTQTETEYISWFLDQLTNFAKFNDVLLFLIAHPTKLAPGQIANLYSISGSAHFFNKTDYGFTFVRLKDGDNVMTNESQVHWQKFRWKHLGHHGISNLKYNYNNGRFEKNISSVNNWDNTNWLSQNKSEPEVSHTPVNVDKYLEPNYEFNEKCPF